MDNHLYQADQEEFNIAFTSFCTLVSLYHNKRLNLPNIFLILLKDEKFREIYKEICNIETDFDAFKMFLGQCPSLYKSKYVKKYLNKNKRKIKKTFGTR